jgi:S1-C subfamily serine protease
MIRRLIVPLLALPLVAQPPAKPLATSEEDAIIARYRAFAAPRTPAKRGPLTAEERNTIRRFKEVRKSVVYLTAIDLEEDPVTGALVRKPVSSGTGFVWDQYGHVVTNHHVVTDDPGGLRRGETNVVEVTLSDGKTYQGRLIGWSFAFDIAVIQVFAPLDAMKPIPIGTSADLQVGQDVLALGNPFGLDQSLSKGIVSALDRPIPTDYQTQILKGIQTDAAINPGNSGGPLLDSSGRLVGMNTAIPAATGVSVGIGFAIPVNTLNRIVPLLISRKQLEPPRMGFTVFSAYKAMQMGVSHGLVVDTVDPDTPAAQAGLRGVLRDAQGHLLQLGDVILAYQAPPMKEAIALKDEGQLAALLEIARPQDEAVFDVLRNGEVIKVRLDLRKTKVRKSGI